MRIPTLLSLSTLVLAFGTTVHAAGAAHRLTLEDLLSIEPVADTALSPDGKTFATVRSGQTVLFSASGGWPVTLTSSAGGKSGLSWSPDNPASPSLARAAYGLFPSRAVNPVG